MFDVFVQASGMTLFTTRSQLLAWLVTWWWRGLDYVEAGEGW